MSLPEPYYENDLVTIYHADCLDILPEIEKVDLVLTDPPYGIGIAKKGSIGGVGKNGKHDNVNNYGKSNWDKHPLSLEQFNKIKSKSKNQIIFGYNYFANILPPTNGLIVWDKKCQNNWWDNFSDGEIAWTSFKKPLRIFRYLFLGCNGNNEITRGKKKHPTQKPLVLIGWMVENWTDKADIILDPFLGSGTTAVACMQLGRKCIGIEIEEKYCEIAAKRCEEARTGLTPIEQEMYEGKTLFDAEEE